MAYISWSSDFALSLEDDFRDYSGLKIWREKKFSLGNMGDRLSQSIERFSFNVLFFHIYVRFFLPLGHFQ